MDVVVCSRITEHLDLDVELIAPEVRHGGRHTFSAGDVCGHDRSLLDRVVPVLDPSWIACVVEPVGDVADRVDARHRRASLCVASDSAADLAGGELDVRPVEVSGHRCGSDAGDDEVGGQDRPVVERDLADCAALARHDLGDADPCTHRDPVGLVHPRDERSDPRPQREC